jgi:hypothetical protein
MLNAGKESGPFSNRVLELTATSPVPDAVNSMTSLPATVHATPTPLVPPPLPPPSALIEQHPVEAVVGALLPGPEGPTTVDGETASAPVPQGLEVASPRAACRGSLWPRDPGHNARRRHESWPCGAVLPGSSSSPCQGGHSPGARCPAECVGRGRRCPPHLAVWPPPRGHSRASGAVRSVLPARAGPQSAAAYCSCRRAQARGVARALRAATKAHGEAPKSAAASAARCVWTNA